MFLKVLIFLSFYYTVLYNLGETNMEKVIAMQTAAIKKSIYFALQLLDLFSIIITPIHH
jgi:hypothetical protein